MISKARGIHVLLLMRIVLTLFLIYSSIHFNQSVYEHNFILIYEAKRYVVYSAMRFGSFGLSTKVSYTVMLCPSLSLSVLALASVSASSLSVYSPPSHMVRHRNIIFGVNMHTCS